VWRFIKSDPAITQRRWVKRRNRCTKCWYDLTGSTGDVCPECGRPKRYADSVWTDGRFHLKWGIMSVVGWGAVLWVLIALHHLARDRLSVDNMDLRPLKTATYAIMLWSWAGVSTIIAVVWFHTSNAKHLLARYMTVVGIVGCFLLMGLFWLW